MKSTFLSTFILTVAAAISCAALPGPALPDPWFDSSLCPPGDTTSVCRYRMSQCSGVRKALTGSGGSVDSIVSCASASGVIPGPDFFLSIGLAFVKGTPEMLADKVSNIPAVTKSIRQCFLTSSGLMNPDDTVNRTAVSQAMKVFLTPPELTAAAIVAAHSCPEPVDFQITGYINCIKSACINSVNVTAMASA